MKKQTLLLFSAVAMIVGFVVGVMLYQGQRAENLGFMAQENASVLAPAHAPSMGADDAKVFIVEFYDPACETCAQFYVPVHDLVDAYPGKIKLIHRYAPFHDGSDVMVKILEASRKQGKYWETLEVMFASQQYWASHHEPHPERIWTFLPQAGVDIDKLKADMADPALDAVLKGELADASTLGVRMTPEFFVNGKPLPSFGLPQLKALVEAEIALQY
jgi:protein-disulfide isomerase